MANTNYKEFFISYSREFSIAFAGKLHQQLRLKGVEAWFDKVNIPSGDFWEDRIKAGIRNAQNFIFVVSPGSMASPHCHAEIEYALQLGKRVFPIIHCELDETFQVDEAYRTNYEIIQKELGKRDWILAKEKAGSLVELESWKGTYENKWPQHDDLSYLSDWDCPTEVDWQSIDNLEEAVDKLLKSSQRHQKYVQMHTHFLNLAYDWEKHGNQTEDLLVGNDRINSEEWLLREFRHGENAPCHPSILQAKYICASKKNAQNLMTQVFVSYAMEDVEIMREVQAALQLNAITTWVHSTDIDKNKIYGREITKGIEEADNFLFFLSDHSLSSYWCLKELQYAISLNKRIIPLNIGETHNYTLPDLEGVEETVKYLLNLQYVDFTDNVAGATDETGKSDFDQDIEDITAEFHRNEDYHFQHKMLLVQALRWKAKGKAAFLLRGHNLDNALTWLRLNTDREEHPPTELHIEYIEASGQSKGMHPTEVFISYSRKDSDFARKLNRALQETGRITWFDQESIASGVDFDQEIFKGIERCQTFLFVISPDAIASSFCERELKHAADFHKRFIPIFLRESDKYQEILPQSFQNIEWIEFHDLNHFEKSLQALILALDTDREHVESHVKWHERALEWETNQKSKDFLLNATACDEAEAWLEDIGGKKPHSTELQKEYISASRKALLLEQEAQLKTEKSLLLRLRMSQIAVGIAIIFLFVSGYFIYDSKKNLAVANGALAESKRLAEIADKSAESEKAEKERAKQALINLQAKEVELEEALSEALAAEKFAEAKRLEAELEKVKAKKESIRALAFKLDNLSKEALGEGDKTQSIQYLLAAWDSLSYWNIDKNYLMQRTFYQTEEKTTHHEVLKMAGHTDFVSAVKISPDGRRIVTASWDNYIKTWDMKGNELQVFERNDQNINAVAFAHGMDVLAVGDEGGELSLWEVSTGKMLKKYCKHTGSILSVALSPDNKYILTGSYDSTAILWDLDGNILHRLEGHKDVVSSVAFHADGKHFITGSYDKSAIVWNANGTISHILKNGHKGYINMVAFSPEGDRVLTAGQDSTAVMWGLKEGELRSSPIFTFAEHKSPVGFVAFSKEGGQPVTGSNDGTVIKWDNYGNVDQKIEVGASGKISVSISPKGDQLLVGDMGGNSSLWNTGGEKPFSLLGHLEKVNGFVLYPKEEKIVTASDDKTAIIWDKEGNLVQTIFAHNYGINTIAISPQGSLLAMGSWDNTGSLWDMEGNKVQVLLGHKDVVSSIAFSPDGSRVLTGSYDSTAILWNARGQLLKKFKHGGFVTSVAFSPNGRQVLTGSTDHSAILWDLNGKVINEFKGHRFEVNAVAFSPKGDKVLTGSSDNTAILWGLDGTIIQRFLRHTDHITSLAFSPNGDKILTGSDDHTAILWGLKGNIMQEFDDFTKEVKAVAFAPSEDKIYVASGMTVERELLPKGIYQKWRAEQIPALLPRELDDAGIFPEFKDILAYQDRKQLSDFAQYFYETKKLENAKLLYIKLLKLPGATNYSIDDTQAEQIAISLKSEGAKQSDLRKLNIQHKDWVKVEQAFAALKD
ncbi:TIR domain-containing protein [Flammeovirgaceae bacterium SG7u.111]|nr:TIR domain-containing protein [Flammeovirgaceae bacterium SG7u.132]WPO33825.1 TIR domain-containing protein [Flammeovirgaceae bacterium SG7u.111]